MPDVNKIYQSQFLRAEQLGGQARQVEIEVVTVEVIGQGEKASQKIVLKFAGVKPRLPLNKTNALMLASLFGPMTENWIGREIELRPERVLFGSKMVLSIRVYEAPPKPVASAPAATSAAPTAPMAPVDAGDAWEPEVAAANDGLVDDLPWQA